MVLETWASWTLRGCLYAKVGGAMAQLGTAAPIRELVCLHGNRTVLHWVLYPVGGKQEPWIIDPEVMSPTGFVRRRLLFKEKFQIWD